MARGLQSSSEAGKFHLFQKLPTELRLKIWEHSLTRTRIVPILCGSKTLSAPIDGEWPTPSTPGGCTSPAPIPANLHTNHEARTEALKHYRLSFGLARRPGQVFFDFTHDVLYFGPREGFMASEAQLRTFLSLGDQAELASLRRIAVNEALFWIGPEYQSLSAANSTVEVLRLLRDRLPALQEIIFVPLNENQTDVNTILEDELIFVEPSSDQRVSVMSLQVKAAMRTVCDEKPAWGNPPKCSILAVESAKWYHS